MTLLPLLFVLAVVTGTWAFDCNSFWPGDFYEDLYNPCTQFTDPQLPPVIKNSNVAIYYGTQGWTNSTDQLQALKSTEKAAQDAITTFSSFADVPDMTFVLVAKKPSDNRTGVAWIPKPGQPCQVTLYTANLANFTPANQSQVIAHEIYHCVQAKAFAIPYPQWNENGQPPFQWWIDGSAEYMSNVVYPTANAEWHYASNYTPTETLYRESYRAALFFQSKELLSSAALIHSWVKSQTFSSSFVAERTRLSSLSGFNDDFHFFMKSYANSEVLDTDGDYIPQITHLPVTVVSTPTLNPTGTIPMSVKPFKGNLTTLKLDPGQTVNMYFTSSQNNVNLDYKTGATWSMIPKGVGTAATLSVPCGDSGMTVQILMTSTDDVALAKADLILTKIEDLPCTCKRDGTSSCSQPNCLAGNWAIDLNNMDTLIRQVLANSPTKLQSLKLSGSGLFSVAPDVSTANFTYTAFEIDMTLLIGTASTPTTTVINGDMEVKLLGNGTNQFGLNILSSEGNVVITSPALGGPLTIPFGESYIPAGMIIQYTCSNTTLTMTGFLNSAPVAGWIYYYNRL